jgi:CDGSH-type Zn-finger protein
MDNIKAKAAKCKIKITKDGPYIVSGNIPLSEQIIVPKGEGYEFKPGRELPQAETYALCRCGKTKTPPFCDGSHTKTAFQGKETASREAYRERAQLIKGPGIDLLDDDRCAFARFCHRKGGNVWELTRSSNKDVNREEAIKAANDCPSGRLTALDKDGTEHEPDYEPSIVIMQDQEKGVSGGIFVKGNIPIEAADGSMYETRNRVVLCRCGRSLDKPFCDAMHVSVNYCDH